MNTRTLLVVGLWAAFVVAAMQLTDGNVAHALVALVVFGVGIVGVRAAVGARARFERLRSWPRPGEPEEYPAGPRRVLLIEAGMAGPE